MLSKLLLTYACGLIDRVRGDGAVDVFYSKGVEQVIYGLFVGVILGLHSWYVLMFALLWAAGCSFGWGTVLGAYFKGTQMGPKYEFWQVGLLRTNVTVALMARGLMWGACILPFGYFDPEVILLSFAMVGIFPLGCWLGKHCPFSGLTPWKAQEFYRGWLVGLTALALGLIG